MLSRNTGLPHLCLDLRIALLMAHTLMSVRVLQAMGEVWQQFLQLYPADLQQATAEPSDQQHTCASDTQQQQQQWQQQLLADRWAR
jgi:hypothetical protein